MSYHQGSVWPLFTGWAAMAEYRGNQPLAGYQLLMENANLTKAQDLGAVTELLSGDFFVPFGRSTSHQLWSSAMVITPTLRGLFGIDIDAQTKTITVNPHLPAGWSSAEIRNIQLPDGEETIHFNRQGDKLSVDITELHGHWSLRTDTPSAVLRQFSSVRKDIKKLVPKQLSIPIPVLEVDRDISGFYFELAQNNGHQDDPLVSGARTVRFRVVETRYDDHQLAITCEGIAGTNAKLELIRHDAIVPTVQKVRTGANPMALISPKDDTPLKEWKEPLLLSIDFPPGEGWKTITVTLTW